MKDEITRAIDQYARLRGDKRGFLLTSENTYFLFENRFCGINGYQLRLQSEHYHIDSSRIEQPIFWGLSGEELFCAATPAQRLEPHVLRLIFHIACNDEPDGILRGICFVKDARAYLSLFADASIEALLLAVETETALHKPAAPPGSDLPNLLQETNLNEMRLLTALYINSQPCRSAENIQKLIDKNCCKSYKNQTKGS